MTIDEFAHWSGLVPFAWLALLRVGGREVSAAHALVAAGLGISVVADAVQRLTGGAFAVTFWYAPMQVVLVLWAFGRGVTDRLAIFGVLLWAGLVSAASGGHAEVFVTLAGSTAICILAWKRDLLTWPLLAYFGAGTAAYLWMLPAVGTEAIYPRWLVYQSCRWMAFALFIFTTVPGRRRVHA